MPRDYIDIGSGPAYEECAQVGSPDYAQRARSECNRFIELIRRKLGPEPEGAQLSIKSNPHDFGSYYEVVCYYEIDNEAATQYAFRCESDAPANWDDPGAVDESAQPASAEKELRRDQTAYLPKLPKCDLCDKTAEYDARTQSGPWAYLCPDHWSSEGNGQLGTGYGQKLISREDPPCGKGLQLKTPTNAPTPQDRVCDSCLACAHEDGVPDEKTQAFLMMEMGSEVADHLCDQQEDPGLPFKCLCGCRRR